MREQKWHRIAARQAGVIHLQQLRRHSLSGPSIHRLVTAGVLRRVHPQVYALVGAPRSFMQAAWAGQLWSRDGILCARTAARLLDLDLPVARGIDIQMRDRRNMPRGLTPWRGEVSRQDRAQLRGLHVTTMPRTVIDCARRLSEQETDALLDSAIRRGMKRSLFIERMEALCVPGRPGGRLIRKLVAEREAEQGLTGSAFERLMLRAIKQDGLPIPVCQWPCVDGSFAAYIDLAYPEFGIAIEADGYRWHDGRRAFESDRKRVSELASRGWRVLQVTWLQLKYEPTTVMARLRRALDTPPLTQFRV
ncbi:MAG: hypothetical protein GEU78_03130 [Actinobacteria bacterium]|nr:hypothetical protein [Actinomycetota bacterium]